MTMTVMMTMVVVVVEAAVAVRSYNEPHLQVQ